MKTYYYLMVLLFATLTTYGQQCKTNEIRKANIAQNPEIKHRVNVIEQFTKTWTDKYNSSSQKTTAVVTVPVVVHVLYRNNTGNISLAQIQSQIDVLNEDFRKLNSNFSSTPTPFQSVAADVEIEFCLAQLDPNGNPTNGVTRTQTTVVEIGNTNDWYSTANGGKNSWDVNKYINIWVCDIDGGGTLGFASPPGTAFPSSSDGLVIDHQYFGTVGTAANSAPNHLGRTATHEMGHYFNLEHVWGLNGGCSDDDMVNDTPNQDQEYTGCPSFPAFDNCTSSGNGNMFCNYLDYSDDNCMTMFTQGQKVRMLAALNGPRSDLLLGGICTNTNVGINESKRLLSSISLYPNPAINTLNIVSTLNQDLAVTLYSVSGQILLAENFKGQIDLDIKELSTGIYFAQIARSDGIKATKKIIINK